MMIKMQPEESAACLSIFLPQVAKARQLTTHLMVTATIVALLMARPTGASGRCFPHAFVARAGGGCEGTFANKEKSIRRKPSGRTLPSPLHRPRRRPHQTSLASTTARNGNGQNAKRGYHVLYQKVLRAPKSSTHTFLLDLVSYLQCVFELPRDLPMPYEITVPDDGDGDGECNPSDNRAVLTIDSPLSKGPWEARLEVEVIGIFPDGSDVHAGPTMAMVALKKHRDPSNNAGGGSARSNVAGGLFAASEKGIANSLDRGLQDLEEGRVVLPRSDPSDEERMNDTGKFDDDDELDAAMKRLGYENVMDAAKTSGGTRKSNGRKVDTPKEPISIERDGMGNVIIDSVASPAATPAKKPKPKEPHNEITATKAESPKRAAPKTSPKPKSAPKTSPAPKRRQTPQGDEDFAIKMARRQAEALMTTVRAGSTTSSIKGTVAISGGDGEFAILAAKNVASRLKQRTQSKSKAEVKEEPERKYSVKGQESDAGKVAPVSSRKVQKGKVQDLSNDETFMKLQQIAREAKGSSWKKTISKVKKGGANSLKISGTTPVRAEARGLQPQLERSAMAEPPTIDDAKTKKETTQNEKSDDEIRDDVMQIAQQNEQVQRELRAATDMMTVDEEDEGLSPEELLEQVLKFGEEKEKEEKAGNGFVEGALGKAKELLRSETDGNNPSRDFKDAGLTDETKRREEEEELRRIFSAGQSTAEKLSRPESRRASNLAKPSITEEDIDELIDAEDTVPRNARVLDDELAELEVRMSRSQGGSGPNKVFDVFSGPEVYNQNVDPETAVNWPGAKEGTRTDVKLATDLETALKQAKFAAAVLMELREEGGEDGGEEVRYFVGTKELSAERVGLLRTCVNEAVKAGIVEDPEIFLAERSRLQMLMSELVSQPEERLEEIAMNYKDLLLSDNLVDLIKERLQAMMRRDQDARREGNEDSLKDIHARERAILINLAQIAQALVKEAQALGAELEVSMLEIIRSICEVAMDPSHKTEEDTSIALTDAVRDMRPLLDDAFIAYLKYAIAEEEGKLARAGVVDDPEHNRWLFVLKIVQEGVYAELSRGVRRYIDHIWYVLRMKTKSERRGLLEKLIDVMPTMDVRPFVKVVVSLAGPRLLDFSFSGPH